MLLLPLLALSVKIPMTKLKRGFIPISLFLMFTFFSGILFRKGRVLFEIWGIIITEEGLKAGGHLSLRIFLFILGAKIITATTPAEDLIGAAVRLMGPLGKWKPVREFVATLSLTLRFIPVIYDEARSLFRDAAGSSSGRTVLGRVKLSASLLAPLFERSVKKARELTNIRNDDY